MSLSKQFEQSQDANNSLSDVILQIYLNLPTLSLTSGFFQSYFLDFLPFNYDRKISEKNVNYFLQEKIAKILNDVMWFLTHQTFRS